MSGDTATSDRAPFMHQIGLEIGRGCGEDPSIIAQISTLLEECALWCVNLICFGDASFADLLSELTFATGARLTWIEPAEDRSGSRFAAFPIVAVAGGRSAASKAVAASTSCVVQFGEVPSTSFEGACKPLRLPTPDEIDPDLRATEAPLLRAVAAHLSVDRTRSDFSEALRSGYDDLWKGYPSTKGDKRATWRSVGFFREAAISQLGKSGETTRITEAMIRLHEAAGSYHYYQRSDYIEALRFFAGAQLKYEADTPEWRFIRALTIETVGLLAFELGIFDVAEQAARQARQAYARSQADSPVEDRFYFDHTLIGLEGDADVCSAYALEEAGMSNEARAALASARTHYARALEIQPLWHDNETTDTYAAAMGAIEALELKLEGRSM